MVDAINIAVSSLQANGERIRGAANNIVNAGTVGALDPADGPAAYTPVDVVAVADPLGSVLTRTIERNPATTTAYDPNSPYANADGAVAVPNVDLASEIVTMKLAEISYRASLDIIKVAGKMQDELLNTFDEKV
jgi:flagellar basal-body rod protein FlgC